MVDGRRPQQLPQAITARLDTFSARVDAFTARFDGEVESFRRLLREKPERRGGRLAQIPNKLLGQFDDELRFLRSWTDNPLTVGAVSPSSPALGRMMAEFVDVDRPGVVIELGPGTGVVTAALIDHGISPERIVAIEYDSAFCALLETRFPGITVIEGDAYDLRRTLGDNGDHGQIASIVSSLPLLTRPMSQRIALLDQSFDLMPEGAPFIQFSYALTPPIPGRRGLWSVTGSKRVWRNLPPARVWCYRRTDT
ncbi:MAG: phospholipid methyltransferase [Hyphomicrobiales bacterium]|nr:phospholipid methyltransferase [Hyphomicrobiales bacterium]